MFDEFGNRMKLYENKARIYLEPKTPVIIRIDGKAFHTFTRGFQKPFDEIFMEAMRETMKYLCENIQGCVFGYTQSDEITLVLIDYQNENSASWFNYNIQKCSSVAASMATMKFNTEFKSLAIMEPFRDQSERGIKINDARLKAIKKGAMFDARAFNMPKNEVANCILWRQTDAARNSTLMVGLHMFSQKQILGKSCSEIREMLITERGVDWSKLPSYKRHGCCCTKKQVDVGGAIRNKWEIDLEMPMLYRLDRKLVNDLIGYTEEMEESK